MFGILLYSSTQFYRRIPPVLNQTGEIIVTATHEEAFDVDILFTPLGFVAVVCAYEDVSLEEIQSKLDKVDMIDSGGQKWRLYEEMESHECRDNCPHKRPKRHYYFI